MTEKAIKEEKPFFVRYNKLIIDGIVYMLHYETNTVRPLKDIQRSKQGVGKAPGCDESFGGKINHPQNRSAENFDYNYMRRGELKIIV